MAAEVAPEKVVGWLAPRRPVAAQRLLKEISHLPTKESRAAILASAREHLADSHPLSAFHALRIVDEMDKVRRVGVGVAETGLPDICWMPLRDRFLVAKYPVTRAQFSAFAPNCVPQLIEADDRCWSDPVTHVTWSEAVEFCLWLSRRLERDVRLPSVVEWEVAAGYPVNEYPWGEWRSEACNVRVTGIGRCSPVGSFVLGTSLASGAADMSGNVWEWCSDAAQDRRAAKGGSWASYAHHAASKFTQWLMPHQSFDEVGFRPVMVA